MKFQELEDQRLYENAVLARIWTWLKSKKVRDAGKAGLKGGLRFTGRGVIGMVKFTAFVAFSVLIPAIVSGGISLTAALITAITSAITGLIAKIKTNGDINDQDIEDELERLGVPEDQRPEVIAKIQDMKAELGVEKLIQDSDDVDYETIEKDVGISLQLTQPSSVSESLKFDFPEMEFDKYGMPDYEPYYRVIRKLHNQGLNRLQITKKLMDIFKIRAGASRELIKTFERTQLITLKR